MKIRCLDLPWPELRNSFEMLVFRFKSSLHPMCTSVTIVRQVIKLSFFNRKNVLICLARYVVQRLLMHSRPFLSRAALPALPGPARLSPGLSSLCDSPLAAPRGWKRPVSTLAAKSSDTFITAFSEPLCGTARWV